MNQDIKELIKQIQKGIVPEGYKKTMVGIIPEDWEVKRLEELSHIIMGQSPSSKNYNQNKKGIPLIQGNADIYNRKTRPKNFTTEITKTCKENDIILSVRAPVGMISLSIHNACIGRGVAAIRSKKEVNQKYLYYYLLSNENQWKKFSQGSTFESVNSSDIKSFAIIVMEYFEQKQIASILETWDRAIELKEKYIQEKQTQKKGLMELLIISDVHSPLGNFENIFERVPNGKYKIKKSDYGEYGKFPVVDQSETLISGYSNQKDKVFNNVDGVIIFGDHTRTIKYADFNFIVGADGTNLLKTKQNYNVKYYYYALISKDIPNTGYNRHYKFLLDMQFPTPPLPEQQRIAKILSTADREIELLKEEVELLKQQKKGLMQLLLTGMIRV